MGNCRLWAWQKEKLSSDMGTRKRSCWGLGGGKRTVMADISTLQASGTEPLNLLPPCRRARHKQMWWLPHSCCTLFIFTSCSSGTENYLRTEGEQAPPLKSWEGGHRLPLNPTHSGIEAAYSCTRTHHLVAWVKWMWGDYETAKPWPTVLCLG